MATGGEGLLRGGADAASKVLIEAFAHDPAMVWFSEGDAARRAAVIDWIIRAHRAGGHDVWIWRHGGETIGAALVEPRPGGLRNLWGLIRTLRRFLALPRAARRRLNAYGMAARRGAPKGHRYLVMVGILGAARGTGQGRAFLAALDAQYGGAQGRKQRQKQGRKRGRERGWALDTENAGNVALYEHLGYELTSTEALGPITIYRMRRAPTRDKAGENE